MAALVSLALLAWLVRNASDSQARKAIVSALLVGETLGFILVLIGQLRGVFNSPGWSVVATHLILALGFAYFQFFEPTSKCDCQAGDRRF